MCAFSNGESEVLRVRYKFSILKQRFRILGRANSYHKFAEVENAFVISCILHNMIFVDDGLDSMLEENINWKRLHPPSKEEEIMSPGTTPLDVVNWITSNDEDTMLSCIVCSLSQYLGRRTV